MKVCITELKTEVKYFWQKNKCTNGNSFWRQITTTRNFTKKLSSDRFEWNENFKKTYLHRMSDFHSMFR